MNKIFDRHTQAAHTAIQHVGRAVGLQPLTIQTQLNAYHAMQPRDFDLLAKTYGLGPTLDYIQHMETLRSGGQHA